MNSSGAPVRPDQFIAEIALPDGKKVTVRSTGAGPADPLYATLANEEFCALRRGGDLPLKVSLTSTARPGAPHLLGFDLAKMNVAAEFAAKHCSK